MVLSATRIRALREPGRYSDGGGLHLYISKTGSKSWVLRITIDGRRRDIGLGAFPSVGLAQAREKAGDMRVSVAAGRDPLAERRAPAMPTFREAARAVHEANTPRWRNDKHSGGLDAESGASCDANSWQHFPGPDRPRGCAARPHPDMDSPAGDGPAGTPADEDCPSGGPWPTASWRPTRLVRPSTVHCPPCQR